MLKKSITYTDFNGHEQTENFYFHLSKADLVEMEMGQHGGLEKHLKAIIEAQDGGAIITEFKKLILLSYGVRSSDGQRFEKSAELRQMFQSTEAYSTLFMELVTDATKAAEFVNGIIPHGLTEEMSKLQASGEKPALNLDQIKARERAIHEGALPEDAVQPPEPVVLTQSEVAEIDSDELKSGLATGRYRLG